MNVKIEINIRWLNLQAKWIQGNISYWKTQLILLALYFCDSYKHLSDFFILALLKTHIKGPSCICRTWLEGLSGTEWWVTRSPSILPFPIGNLSESAAYQSAALGPAARSDLWLWQSWSDTACAIAVSLTACLIFPIWASTRTLIPE